jgi:hypothetical protein
MKKKYELTQTIFRELLHHTYKPFEISFSDEWLCRISPGVSQIDRDKDYLGIIPLNVEVVHNGTITQTVRLTAQCMQNKFIPSLEDQAGGYAFRIFSSKSELLYRAMQVALYDYTEASTTVQLYSDLDSKKGDKQFLQQMKQWLRDYESIWKPWEGELLPSDQFLFLTYDLTTSSIVQDKQHVLNSAVFIALLKGILKREILLSLPMITSTIPAKNPRVWKIAPGEYASSWSDALENKEIFVGWDELGDLRKYKTRDELIAAYKKVYSPDQEPTRNVYTLWSFCHEIYIGDIVIANRGWKQLVGIGKVTGDYEFKPERGRFPNRRKIEWIITHDVQFAENVFSTPTLTPVHQQRLSVIQKEVLKQVPDGEQKWRNIFGELQIAEDNSIIDDFQRFLHSRQFHFSKEFITRFITSLQTKPFVILSGMSGTGKTKIAQLFADYMKQGQGKKPKKAFTDSTHGGNAQEKQFQLTIQPYYMLYSRMIVPKEIVEWISIEGLEHGVEIDLIFNQNQTEKALLKQTKQGYVRLGFRKEFMAWLTENFEVGDRLQLRIHDDGATLSFSAIEEAQPQEDDNLAFLSVRPDWLDHRGLLGSYNPLTETYEATPLLKTMLKARQNPSLPYFVILDEMNLAKVEYYFSDFLSCMESRRIGTNGEIIQESIFLHNQHEELLYVDADHHVYAIPPRIEIPKNLYIIGTVNMDETTYMFSPKVLDRANVIECNEVDFHRYWSEEEADTGYQSIFTWEEKKNWFTIDGEFHHALYVKEYRNKDYREDLEEAYFRLVSLHQLMEEEGYSFGYRVVDEIMNYLHITNYYEYCTLEEALDAQIVQKILPKLHGNRKQMESLLLKLIRFTIGEHVELDLLFEQDKDILAYEEQYRYPLSGKKIYKMYQQLMKNGYCSFIS